MSYPPTTAPNPHFFLENGVKVERFKTGLGFYIHFGDRCYAVTQNGSKDLAETIGKVRQSEEWEKNA
ncbi:MAG TPA: hypothetical protein VKY85_07845 [Candidatus Angelobacter sp.]|nr:hypothetical protein [Candidatus Angelobacter sp.]